jgi:glucose/arabinose dehydrogenase
MDLRLYVKPIAMFLITSFMVSVVVAATSLQGNASLSGYQFKSIMKDGTYRQPTAVRHAGDGTNRLFVVEKSGLIYSLQPSSSGYRSRLFLDIKNRVNSRGSEQGLLGLAFHPSFKTNGLFYVNYISQNDRTIISSFRASTGVNGTANANSEQLILAFSQPYSNHNGGDMAFGKDGFLYIASGDGGSAGDPSGYSQNLQSLLGKILRIDVRPTVVNGVSKPYRIPAGNPFVSRSNGARPEIYAYGLRNPWRISFDRLNGELWAADVGQNQREEVNVIRAGGNYGWNKMEGSSCYQPAVGCKSGSLIPPIFEYSHATGGKSITGGYVYRGTAVQSMRGKYLMADFISGRLWTLQKRTNGIYTAARLSETIPLISSFGEDEKGELYFVTYRGALMKMVNR